MIQPVDITEEGRQYCYFCGHTMTFHPSVEFKVCSHCGLKNKNQTKARFKAKIYQLRDKNSYKVTRLEEDDDGI